MRKIESFAQFTIYAENTTLFFEDEPATAIRLYNGSDEIASETFFNVTDYLEAARDFMRRNENAYLLDDITAAGTVTRHNDRDYELSFTDCYGETTTMYFRRYSEDSRYYKQFLAKPLMWME